MKIELYNGDCLEIMQNIPCESIDTIVTSPPYYGLRDYANDKQIGLEETPEEYIEKLKKIFHEAKKILKNTGNLWLNLGDTYNQNWRGGGIKTATKKQFSNTGTLPFMANKPHKIQGIRPKELIGIPWRVAFALQEDGWILRQDIIWAKPNPMPESIKDRCTKSHEYIFLFVKQPKYYFDNEAIKEDAIWKNEKRAGLGRLHYREEKRQGEKGTGQENFVSIVDKRNKRDVWTVSTKPFKGLHFATFPEELILPCILAGCPEKGTVLDMFMGSGTTGVVCKKNNRNFIGIDLNDDYVKMAKKRINNTIYEENLF